MDQITKIAWDLNEKTENKYQLVYEIADLAKRLVDESQAKKNIKEDMMFGYEQSFDPTIKKEKPIPLPIEAKNLTAGIDWSGNVGKLIANLLLKPETFCEAYTVSSAQNLTWGEVAKLYEKNIGAKFEWVSTKEFLEAVNYNNYYTLIYDRLFDRKIDNSKILNATGLTKSDFFQ